MQAPIADDLVDGMQDLEAVQKDWHLEPPLPVLVRADNDGHVQPGHFSWINLGDFVDVTASFVVTIQPNKTFGIHMRLERVILLGAANMFANAEVSTSGPQVMECVSSTVLIPHSSGLRHRLRFSSTTLTISSLRPTKANTPS